MPGLGRSPGEWNGNPLQHSCLESSMDRGAWWTTVHEVTKSQSYTHTHIHTHTHTKGARMPWTEEPGGLQSLGSQRVSQTDSERQTPSPPKEHARTHTQKSPKLAFLCFCFSWWLLGADAPKERSREARRTRYYESVREKGFLFRLLGGAGPDRLPGRPSPEAALAQGSRQEQSLGDSDSAEHARTYTEHV